MNFSPDEIQESDIAIIAMCGRFPGAKNIDAFWENLRLGVETISWLSDQELLRNGVQPELLQNPNYVRASAVLDDIELFDANFFGFNPKEAEILDPQQRIFLECAWETVEQAGYNPQTYTGSIGVYAGLIESRYLLKNLYPNQELNQSVSTYQLSLANEKDFLPIRVAYKLNLTGPAVNIQTACSTSLVAVHMACQSLVNGECDMALAGGVAISVPQKMGYLYQEGMVLSPDGHCRAFDAKAQGTFRGNGVGIVMLKRAKDAITDRDYIHAIIKGSAINNDGMNKIGFTAPSVEGQAAVIAEAQAIAGIDVETITYVETHGTGTNLGDPIEIAALTQAFHQNSKRKGYCAIGSLKTNMGHLDTAAGVAGLIKTVLALKHQQIPPSLHFETPNPEIDFANSPFYVNTHLSEWKTDGIKRRAGVSSFGIGGTNAHVVLEEAPILESSSPGTRPVQLLVLSAKTSSALETATNNLSAHLKQHPELNLADVAYTLNVGRQAFEHRRILVRSESEQIFTGQAKSSPPSTIFMFSGQGSQYVNMAREIYETETIFREQFDYCAELLQPELGQNLRDIVYPSSEQTEAAAEQLQQTAIAQPAIFTIEYALAKLWESWGVSPQGFIGHSIGEYVAACLAGVFSLADALSLVAVRGRMMQQLPPGAMLSVPLSATEIEPFLGKLCLAAINEPSRCVISGTKEAVTALENQLASQGIESRYLHTSHAFHSHMMEPILELFAKAVQKVTLNVPRIPYISNLTGTWITAAQATNPDYWSQHLRSPVQFSRGINLLLKDSDHLLLEVGPGRTLSTFAKRHFSTAVSQVVLTSVRHPQEVRSDMDFLLTTLGQLWLAGVEIDWFGFYANQNRHRLPLPTYPFERQRYWVEAQGTGSREQREALSKKTDIADWFYIPSWKRSILPVSTKQVAECWLFFADESGFGEQLVNRLVETGQKLIIVKAGDSFSKKGDGIYTLNPQQRDDYDRLLNELQALQFIPNQLVHCWSVRETPVTEHPLWVEEAQNLGFYSLLYLAQALGQINFTDDCQLTVVSNNMWEIASEGWLSPEKATLMGPINVIPQEYSNITCRSIDIVLPPAPWQKAKLCDQLLKELQTESEDRVIAYRGNYRWVRSFESVRLEMPQASTLPLKRGGVYLITGGLGGIGLSLAEYLAKTVQAKLILIGRSHFPARSEWEQWLLTYHEQDATSRKIQKIQEMEALGAEVLVIGADVANQEQMHKAIANSLTHFGDIHGVIHAAGVPAGGIIQRKTRSMTEEIFAPKIKGTLVLDQVLQDIQLDWLILCSSLNSVQAVFGQVDYCAANAFLDAFAHYKTNQGTNTIAINWDAWQEVGMAAQAVWRSPTGVETLHTKLLQFPIKKADYPLFDQYINTGDQAIYRSQLSVCNHWVVSEHRVMGKATLPGTAYLEIAREAFAAHTQHQTMILEDVIILKPLVVEDDEEKEVCTILKKQGETWQFSITSCTAAQPNVWQEHAQGEITSLEIEQPQKSNLATIKAECENLLTNNHIKSSITALVEFGSRWENLKQRNSSRDKGLAIMELAEAFVADLPTYQLHPALLDIALNFLSIPEEATYLPFSYGKIKIKAPLTQRIYSYIERASNATTKLGSVKYNVTILDEQGRELVEIEDYTLREFNQSHIDDASAAGSTSNGLKNWLQGNVQKWLLPSEGVDVFSRILGYGLTQVLVSTVNLETLIKQENTFSQTVAFQNDATSEKTNAGAYPRPQLSNPYVAPRNPLEEAIAQVWQQFLGIAAVGVDDHFLDLGGDSLLATQIIAQLRDRLAVKLSLASLFETPTVAEMAASLVNKFGIDKQLMVNTVLESSDREEFIL